MPRLFTFGCSFTQYMWPTWADIIGYDLGIEYYNYAIAGLGNVGIQHRILEADIKHTFTDDDIILIMWSSWCREDRVKNSRWLPAGSVIHHHNEVYDRKFVKKYWDYSNDVVKNSTAIITANKIYKDNIKWQGGGFPFFVSENDVCDWPVGPNGYANEINLKLNKPEQFLTFLYNKKLPKIDIINTYVNDWDPLPFNCVDDCHPDVKKHLSFVTNYVYPKMGKTINESTVTRFNDLQNYIETNNKKKCELKDFIFIIQNTLRNNFNDIYQVMNFNPLVDMPD
jgi:hypothetical protein